MTDVEVNSTTAGTATPTSAEYTGDESDVLMFGGIQMPKNEPFRYNRSFDDDYESGQDNGKTM